MIKNDICVRKMWSLLVKEGEKVLPKKFMGRLLCQHGVNWSTQITINPQHCDQVPRQLTKAPSKAPSKPNRHLYHLEGRCSLSLSCNGVCAYILLGL